MEQHFIMEVVIADDNDYSSDDDGSDENMTVMM